MTNPVAFDFEGQSVRTVEIDGIIWFVAADVCKVLEHSNASAAVSRLDEDERGVRNVYTPSGDQEMLIINESGLYSLILTSRKEAAKRFKKWVTAEVLPTLRKTGRYDMAGNNQPTGQSRKNLPTSLIPKAERHYDLALVREARAVYGEAGARHVWANSDTLPDMSQLSYQDRLDDLARMRGEDCLRYLLRYAIGRGIPLSEMILYAQYRDDVNSGLESRGIKVSPLRYRGKVIFASHHAFLNKVFAPTDWAGIYQRVLMDIPGAYLTRGPVLFGDDEIPGVIIPLVVINNLGGF
jgi:prophage antirepressor-like protein